MCHFVPSAVLSFCRFVPSAVLCVCRFVPPAVLCDCRFHYLPFCKALYTMLNLFLPRYALLKAYVTHHTIHTLVRNTSHYALMTAHFIYNCTWVWNAAATDMNFNMINIFFFLYIVRFFLCILCSSTAPQRPAHGTVSSQVATHLRTDRVCRVLGRSWIRTQDY
jgi:hypothetical protein